MMINRMIRMVVLTGFILSGLSGNTAFAGGQQDKELFNVIVNLGYEVNSTDLQRDSINYENISKILMAKVNELARNKKFTVVFANSDQSAHASVNVPEKPNLYFNISLIFNKDNSRNGVNVFYAEDNDYTFQSIKYANMVVSEIKSSRLSLKVNGMIESDLPQLKTAGGPALQVDINLMNSLEDKLILTQEEKLNALAKMIYACIERISKS